MEEEGGMWLGFVIVVSIVLSTCDEVCLFWTQDVAFGSLLDSCFYFIRGSCGHHLVNGTTSFWKHRKRCQSHGHWQGDVFPYVFHFIFVAQDTQSYMFVHIASVSEASRIECLVYKAFSNPLGNCQMDWLLRESTIFEIHWETVQWIGFWSRAIVEIKWAILEYTGIFGRTVFGFHWVFAKWIGSWRKAAFGIPWAIVYWFGAERGGMCLVLGTYLMDC